MSILFAAGLIMIGAIAPKYGDFAIAQSEFKNAQQSEPIQDKPRQYNDRRSPVAKINPKKPIQIRIVNQSKVDILTLLTEPTSREQNVRPQKSVTFGRLHTNYLPPPIDLTVYTNVQETNLDARIKVIGNELIVTITAKPATYGMTRAVYVDEQGAIYLY
ncbi:hypothetical protein [Calothrix sp. 336/3]|uniref:hypothetical protein n=1 Tax=Calothrix sp. 336/3 TaxID=1337936 RepID=UPI0004E45D67|nr:hypothetical protein [Calothrix sp. 336/3]AKG21359.1 hypothetical protein IJ00_08690 [Calothrix sp. 336/3]